MGTRHVVLVRFKASVTPAEIQSIFDELAALRGHLKGITAMSFGASVSPEGLEQGFLHGFTMDFADAAARDAYLVDDAHKRAGSRMVGLLEGGRDGLVVFDLQTMA